MFLLKLNFPKIYTEIYRKQPVLKLLRHPAQGTGISVVVRENKLFILASRNKIIETKFKFTKNILRKQKSL